MSELEKQPAPTPYTSAEITEPTEPGVLQHPQLRLLRPWPPRPIDRAWKICVSGGIGSGKSTLVRALGDCGAEVFDADAVLRSATAPGGVALPALRQAFGSGVFTRCHPSGDLDTVTVRHPDIDRASETKAKPGDGTGTDTDSDTLDRAALAALIFADPGAKARLEGILHPLLWQDFDRVVAALPPEAILVAEIPLVTETGNAGRFDVVIMVDAPHETRIKRLATGRAMNETSARERIAAQATREDRAAIAHVWVENTGSKADLSGAARWLWTSMISM
ncbi:dephospho-CoA kinase [Mobiluncus mulieris]|uniref:dephospho-CoA kinase n=1 Tax=Mobiluncus mulieris TaxID=2052 RepID=UPI0021E20F64|nr:dephospho-CoA kinase [Mobiluncus mulieris]MCV0001686.1 dephospho-CoA kinase [Mobiluncus mulieris]